MAKNISTNSKTVKTMLESMPNDSWTIDKVLYYANYNDKINVPYTTLLHEYDDYFSQFLVTADVAKKFYYQPAAFAENYYGTPDLDFLVLFFARMTTLFDFNKSQIQVLPKEKLVELNKLFVQYESEISNSKDNPTDYIKESEVAVISSI